MRILRSILLFVFLAAFSLMGNLGCTRGSANAAFYALHAAAAVAEVVAVASILHHHDDHFHGYGCGHRYRYYDNRYNYWYDGHWEYYDAGTGYWYRY